MTALAEIVKISFPSLTTGTGPDIFIVNTNLLFKTTLFKSRKYEFTMAGNRITQREIARMCEVSQGIVSMVLTGAPQSARIPEATRRRILECAASCRYRVNALARQLRSGRSTTVLVVASRTFSFFMESLLRLLELQLIETGFRMMTARVASGAPDVAAQLEPVLEFDYAGVICLDHCAPVRDASVSAVLARHAHVVYLSEPAQDPKAPFIDLDFGAGVAEAVEYLTQARPGPVALCLNGVVDRAMEGRRQGYLEGLERCGIALQPELIWRPSELVPEGFFDGREYNFGWAERIYRELIVPQRPSGVIVWNDQAAVALVKQLTRRNVRIPGEVAVIGYGAGDILGWACEPPLTSISHGDEEIARLLCRRLTELLAGEDAPRRTMVASRLIRRESA